MDSDGKEFGDRGSACRAGAVLCWIFIGLFSCFIAEGTSAQIFINGGPNQLIMPAPAAVDQSNGVYVRDSAIAMEKLALAKRMERAHEWNKSADVYQEILEKYPDRVVEQSEQPHIKRAWLEGETDGLIALSGGPKIVFSAKIRRRSGVGTVVGSK